MSDNETGPHRVAWRKSSYSNGNGGCCVEVADPSGRLDLDGKSYLSGEKWAVRDSKDPDGPVLRFTPRAWSVFAAGVRAGEFD